MRIPVYYVYDRGINDEARVEALWGIETFADFRKLVGRKLGIGLADGQYLRGWLQGAPEDSDDLCLLRESNKSEQVSVRLVAIQVIEILKPREDSPDAQVPRTGGYYGPYYGPYIPPAKPARARQRSRKQPRASEDVAAKKCAHGRNPTFCCDCRYAE
jgi:hypothetical protein